MEYYYANKTNNGNSLILTNEVKVTFNILKHQIMNNVF